MTPNVRLFLRTEELAQAWRVGFSGLDAEQIAVLPSLELADEFDDQGHPGMSTVQIKFGIIGQIRPGKAIEWLVPMFVDNPDLGKLTIAGAFNDPKQHQLMTLLKDYPYFHDRYLTEDEMIQLGREQDYLVMLYDDWDPRMEAATLYFAAKVNRPVIVYGDGWCGRMVRTYVCGIIAPHFGVLPDSFFKRIVAPSGNEYARLLKGLAQFRREHSGTAVRSAFLGKISNDGEM
jgi:hypothetical protein